MTKIHMTLSKETLDFFSQKYESPLSKGEAFVDLARLACECQGAYSINGREFMLGENHVLVSQNGLSRRWKWSPKKVKRYLEALKELGQIETIQFMDMLNVRLLFLGFQSLRDCNSQPENTEVLKSESSIAHHNQTHLCRIFGGRNANESRSGARSSQRAKAPAFRAGVGET